MKFKLYIIIIRINNITRIEDINDKFLNICIHAGFSEYYR